MKDYLLILMGFGGFVIVFVTIEFCETTLSQLFVGLGIMMMFLPIPIDLMLDMYEEKKGEK